MAGEAALYAPPGDDSALAEAIDGLLLDDTARADLGRRALERARAFSVAEMIAGHLAVYEHAARTA